MSTVSRLQAFDAFFDGVHRRVIADVIKPAPDMKALDVGCGTGGMSVLLTHGLSAGSVVALDPNGQHLRSTRTNARESGCEKRIVCTLGDVEKLQFLASEFDIVWCSRVIHHHLPNPQPALSEMYRVLKPGGRLFLRENSASDFMTVNLGIEKDPGLWQRLGKAQLQWFQNKFQHRRPSNEEWLQCMKEAGFVETRAVSLPYIPAKPRVQIAYIKSWLEGILGDDDSPEHGDLLSNADRLAARQLIRHLDELSQQPDDTLPGMNFQVSVSTQICVGVK